jgi:hypothetical protein
MQTRKYDAAFPAFDSDGDSVRPGLSKREYFASVAMNGMITANVLDMTDPAVQRFLTQVSVEMANELIKALNEDDTTIQTEN